MKKQIIAVVVSCLCAVTHALAQGTVNFNNFVSGSVDAPIRNEAGVLCSGAGYFAQLWGGPVGGPLVALGTPGIVPFRTGGFAGYVNVGSAGGRPIAGVLAGQNATVQVRAWAAASGADWLTASTSPGGIFGSSPLLTLATGGVPDPVTGVPSLPSNLIGLQGFQLVPEPATYALFGLGAMALFLRRRK